MVAHCATALPQTKTTQPTSYTFNADALMPHTVLSTGWNIWLVNPTRQCTPRLAFRASTLPVGKCMCLPKQQQPQHDAACLLHTVAIIAVTALQWEGDCSTPTIVTLIATQ